MNCFNYFALLLTALLLGRCQLQAATDPPDQNQPVAAVVGTDALSALANWSGFSPADDCFVFSLMNLDLGLTDAQFKNPDSEATPRATTSPVTSWWEDLCRNQAGNHFPTIVQTLGSRYPSLYPAQLLSDLNSGLPILIFGMVRKESIVVKAFNFMQRFYYSMGVETASLDFGVLPTPQDSSSLPHSLQLGTPVVFQVPLTAAIIRAVAPPECLGPVFALGQNGVPTYTLLSTNDTVVQINATHFGVDALQKNDSANSAYYIYGRSAGTHSADLLAIQDIHMEDFVPTTNTFVFFMCMYVNTTRPSATPTIRFEAWGRPEVNRTSSGTIGTLGFSPSGIQVVAVTDMWVIPPLGNLTRLRQAADIDRQLVLNVSAGSSLAYTIRTDNQSTPVTHYLNNGEFSAKIKWPAGLPVEISMFNPDLSVSTVVSITITPLNPSNTGSKLAIGLGISLGFLALVCLGIGIAMLYRWRRRKRLAEMGQSGATEDMVGMFNSYKKATSLGNDPKIMIVDNMATSDSGTHGAGSYGNGEHIGFHISLDDPEPHQFIPAESLERPDLPVAMGPEPRVVESHQPALPPNNIYFNSEPMRRKNSLKPPFLNGRQSQS